MTEIVGFWMFFCGWLALLFVAWKICAPDGPEQHKHVEQKDERSLIVQVIVIILPAIAALIMMIGLHLYFLGNQGRYPGYPLDVIIKWFE